MSTIVNNSASNFTLYYNILNYFKTIMENHPIISAVSQGDIFDIDQDEFPDYPIGNVQILDATFNVSSTDYTIQLIIADKVKNKNNESIPRSNKQQIPYYGTNDVVDIHANTLGVINDLTSYTQRSVAAFEINSEIVSEPFMDRFNNGLAGWVATFTLTTHNDRPICIWDLLPTTTTTAGPTTTTSTTTAAPTTTSTTTLSPSLYDFYTAEVYTCTDCSVIANNVKVAKVKLEGSVVFGRVYHNSGSVKTNDKYLITNTASPIGPIVAVIDPLISHSTCETACAYYTTTTTTLAP